MGAAIITTQRRVSPADGWEFTLQINHLSNALLSLLLLPVLQRSARQQRRRTVLGAVTSMSVRISALAVPVPAEGETLLRAVDHVRGYGAQRQQYGLTKLLFLYWLKELRERVVRAQTGDEASNDAEVVIQSCDFGVVAGGVGVTSVNWEAKVFAWLFGRLVETCANVVVNACVAHKGQQGGPLVDYDPAP